MAQQWIDLDAVELWNQNYNKGDVPRLKRLFKKFGFNNALKMRDGVVFAGNNSTIALRELRAENWQPRGSGIRVEKGQWQIAWLDLSHLSLKEAKAFALGDNVGARAASPDLRAQLDVMGEIDTEEENLTEVIFTTDELAEFDELSRLADGLAADLDGAPGEGKRVGLERAKQVKVVVPISELETFEAALLKTGEVNRGDALLLVCKAYLNGKK